MDVCGYPVGYVSSYFGSFPSYRMVKTQESQHRHTFDSFQELLNSNTTNVVNAKDYYTGKPDNLGKWISEPVYGTAGNHIITKQVT